MVSQEPLEAVRLTLLVTNVLDGLGVEHVVGGSLASSLLGVPRATNDVDIVASLRVEHVAQFVAALGEGFYADDDMIRDAIVHRSSFNVIHLETMFKVDVFVPLLDVVTRAELRRGVRIAIDGDRTLRLASAEDTIAQKLAWFRKGGETSDRQWSDALGVLVVQQQRLDMEYLRETSDLLGVLDLLDRALVDVASRTP